MTTVRHLTYATPRREYALQGVHVGRVDGTASHPPYDVVASFPIFSTLEEAEQAAEFVDRQRPDAEPARILSRGLGAWEVVER